jgi:hypothetical protein
MVNGLGATTTSDYLGTAVYPTPPVAVYSLYTMSPLTI